MAETTSRYEYLLPKLVLIVQYPKEDKYKHSGYRQACDHALEMGVHLYGEKPEKLLNRVRPREDPAITAYRLESYEPTTTSTAGKALAITNKIFNPKLHAIHAGKNSDGEILFKYATVTYPVFNSIVNFLSEYGLKKAMADPNAVFLVEPKEVPYIPDGDSVRVDVTKRIDPIVSCYPCSDVHLIAADYALLFIREEKDEKGISKHFYKYVDKLVISEFYLTSTDSKNYYVVEESSYAHNFDALPLWSLGGAYSQKHDKNYSNVFESFFYPAVPFWNKAINAESDLDGAFISHLHPQKWEVADECEFVEHTEHGHYACDHGYIFNSHTGNKYTCSSCSGTGRKSVKSPYSIYQVSKDKLQPESGAPSPPAGYIDVPTAATEMLVARVDKLLERGLSALAMDIVNEIGENQSGVAKELDRTELNDFLGKVRDLFYDKHLVNIFYFFAKYMFIGRDDKQIAEIEPTVIKPSDFNILTTQELTEQLKTAKGANINPAYLQAKQIEIQNKEFQAHPEALQELNLIVSLDPYAEIIRTDLDLMIFSKTISKTDAIIHDNIRTFVRRAIEENPKFIDLKYMEQMEVLRGFAEEISEQIDEETKVEIDLTAIEPEPEAVPDDAPAAK